MSILRSRSPRVRNCQSCRSDVIDNDNDNACRFTSIPLREIPFAYLSAIHAAHAWSLNNSFRARANSPPRRIRNIKILHVPGFINIFMRVSGSASAHFIAAARPTFLKSPSAAPPSGKCAAETHVANRIDALYWDLPVCVCVCVCVCACV